MHINMTLGEIAKFIGEAAVIVGFFTPIIVWIKKVSNGTKCQLRNDMLQIYYRYEDSERIPQYQYENFVAMYDAYKSLKGNSFIEKIYKDIQGWEVTKHIEKK